MPSNKTLSDQQIQSIRDSLQRRFRMRRQELVDELSRANDPDVQQAAEQVRDVSDEAVIDQIEGLEFELAGRHLDELRQIDQAWRRLSEGRISECSDCGETIDPERLVAMPTTTRCIGCQERYEHQYTTQPPAY